MTEIRLFCIPGTLRRGSTNRLLLAKARRLFGPADYDETDLRLPLYDGDLEVEQGIPAEVQRLADQIAAVDAVVIATPEYNQAPPSVLKNALDWVEPDQGAAFPEQTARHHLCRSGPGRRGPVAIRAPADAGAVPSPSACGARDSDPRQRRGL